jgi:D-arabinose 1-dehydrogenase-like Zn-dependent alcohol dehydrogenase
MEAVVFSGTASKREEALKFGASKFYTAEDLTNPESIEKVDTLLITSGVMPDLSTSVSLSPQPVPQLTSD